MFFNKLSNFFGINRSRVNNLWVIKFSEENNLWTSYSMFFSSTFISSVNVCSLIISSSSFFELGEITSFFSEENNSDLVVCNLSFKLISTYRFGWWSTSFVYPAYNLIFCSTTSIFSGLSVYEPFKCWITLNSIFGSKI
jgi:hypothetical protein